MISIEKIMQEAQCRMETLVEKFKLNPNLNKYLKEGKVYYSYITGNGTLGSIDTISYNASYEDYVMKFEKETGCYVYHAIENSMIYSGEKFNFLNLLYVSDIEDDWEYSERLNDDYICAYVINIDTGFSEFGDIFLDGAEFPNGITLVRKA